MLHIRRGQSGWLWAAAVVAGIAAGTKYQGVLLVAPVMFYAILRTPATVWQRAVRALTVGAVSLVTYLATTPGTILDPINFADGFAIIFKQYSTGHSGYSVTSGLPHLELLIRYLLFDLFSPYPLAAVFFFTSAVIGGTLYWQEDRRLAALLVGFPVLFAAFFCWNYAAFIVRNFLLLAPFLALLSARGLAQASLRLRPLPARLALVFVICCALVANAAWLISAAQSIRHSTDSGAARKAVAYVRNHPHTRFRVSPKVEGLVVQHGLSLPPNAMSNEPEEVVFFAQSEGASPFRWTVNEPWLTRAVFGPREINFNYYSNWAGSDRVVVMSLNKARAAGVPLAQ